MHVEIGVAVKRRVLYFAREAAEVEGLLEDPVTGQADVAGALEGPGLRPRLQKDHLRTVDRVRLHACMHSHKFTYRHQKRSDLLHACMLLIFT